MKRTIIAVAAILILAAMGAAVFHGMSARAVSGEDEVSRKAAASLQSKIDAIKKARGNTRHVKGSSHVELSEVELESYVIYEMQDDIPAHIDSFEVQLDSGTVAAHTQLTFPQNPTGNSMIDLVVGGTHDLFVKGALMGAEDRGKFDLGEVRVDGIPVPKILIQTLFNKYVKPQYPEADLSEPFDLPWDIREITIAPHKATVVY